MSQVPPESDALENESQTDRNLALELVRVTEAAALAASRWMGLGKKNEADGAAVEAMRQAFDTVDDRRHRGDRRRRDGRGADAVYRREGRRRRPADGHRRRSAGGHHADRQGRPERDGRRSRWPSAATSCTRPTSTWTRSRSAAGCPHGVVDLDDAGRREPAQPGARQEMRRVRPGRLHPRPRPPQGADRANAARPARASC